MTTFLSLQSGGAVIPAQFLHRAASTAFRPARCGHTPRSPLDTLESAIGFHMRDWWQPTKANFFGHLKKPQIIAALE